MLFVRNGLRSDVFVTSGKMPGRFVRIDSNNSLSTIRPPTLCFAGPSACSLQLLIAFRFAEFFRPPRNRHFSDFSRPCALDRCAPLDCPGRKALFSWPIFFDFLRVSELRSAAEIRAKARWGMVFTWKFRAKLRWVQEKKLDLSSPEQGV